MSRPVPAPPGGEVPGVWRIVLAFLAVYLIWGSTYLAIRFAIETMPPLAMASVRFIVAGTLLYLWSRWRGAVAPTLRQWRDGAVSGTLLLAGGNGAVVVAQQWIPSGLAALLVASVPLWLVILDAAFGARERPSPRTVFGLVCGFLGVGVLAGSPGAGAGGRYELLGALLVLGGSVAWAAGSLFSRYARLPARPRMLVATQMLSGGAVLGLMSAGTGEAFGFDLRAVSPASWLALAYLVVAGAIVGYSAYIWLLTVVSPARVGTYAYVNPVVALLLGWAFADEPLTFRSVLAATIILGSVMIITTDSAAARRALRPVGHVRKKTS